jgi:hypothetical protein
MLIQTTDKVLVVLVECILMVFKARGISLKKSQELEAR